MDKFIREYIQFFETLSPQSLGNIERFFATDAVFQDPFNRVQGTGAIRHVFEHMFATCESPRFSVTEQVSSETVAYLRWIFEFGPQNKRRSIEGVSRVSVNPAGQITEHIDYWDPARQLYESVPLLGFVLRKFRQRLSSE